MTHEKRWIRNLVTTTTGLVAAVMLAVPTVSFAGGRDVRVHGSYCAKHDRDHDHDDRRRSAHRRHDSPRFSQSRWGSRRVAIQHPVSHRAGRQHESAYGCRPCQKRFGNRGDFHAHIRHHHHIPTWQIPFLVFSHVSGWIFFG